MLISLRSQSVKLIAHLKSSTEESVIIIFHLDILPMQTISTLKPFLRTILSILDFRGAFVVESMFFFFSWRLPLSFLISQFNIYHTSEQYFSHALTGLFGSDQREAFTSEQPKRQHFTSVNNCQIFGVKKNFFSQQRVIKLPHNFGKQLTGSQ